MGASPIWIISPNRDIRELIGLNLSKRGSCVFDAPSHRGPWREPARPCLIILDADAAEEAVWEEAHALRGNPAARDTPLILLLTDAPPPSRLGGLHPADWIAKPLDMDTLLSMVGGSLSDPATCDESQCVAPRGVTDEGRTS